MDIKLKQRIVGSLVFFALLLIFMPTISYKMQESSPELASSIPTPPQMPDAGTVVSGDWYLGVNDQTFLVEQQWVVQLGVFSNSGNVDRLMKKLRDNQVPVYKLTENAKNQTTFRVFVGPVTDQNQATRWQQQLSAHWHLSGIVKRISL